MGGSGEGLKRGLGKVKEMGKELERELFIGGGKEGMKMEVEKGLGLEELMRMGEVMG